MRNFRSGLMFNGFLIKFVPYMLIAVHMRGSRLAAIAGSVAIAIEANED